MTLPVAVPKSFSSNKTQTGFSIGAIEKIQKRIQSVEKHEKTECKLSMPCRFQ